MADELAVTIFQLNAQDGETVGLVLKKLGFLTRGR
jgi:hypothetical protein